VVKRLPALQVQSPEFKPQSYEKNKNTNFRLFQIFLTVIVNDVDVKVLSFE
jgi:hypothetical protein